MEMILTVIQRVAEVLMICAGGTAVSILFVLIPLLLENGGKVRS
jgi:hypothetical protein